MPEAWRAFGLKKKLRSTVLDERHRLIAAFLS